ncbi:MAG: pseudouridine synthase [Proteobacteria bacterium]|nr:pseudouridine synthase [Pseudomonadota bacterium]MDE3208192.1 pseudouridine synthase [Pseudomonadota bacterium]
MTTLILFNKPYGVVCQFSPHEKHPTLKNFIPITHVYPAGRLDTDSEGLLLLTDNGSLQYKLSHPDHHLPKTYWVQVEGEPSDKAIKELRTGVNLGPYTTRPALVKQIDPPEIPSRNPPVRYRKSIPTNWLEIILNEGKNRQIRHMTAKVGYPTLRLIRYSIGNYNISSLNFGQWSIQDN